MRFLSLTTLLAAAQVGAASAPPVVIPLPLPLPAAPGTLVSIYEENDKFVPRNKDRYYTQGLRFSFSSDEHHYWALSQEINTPSDTTTPDPLETDMPYSGALFLTYGYGTVLERGGRNDCLISAEVQFGVIGPASGAAYAQTKFHELAGITRPAGWETQLPNEPALNINLEFKRRFRLDARPQPVRDLILRTQLQLGTLRTHFLVAGQLRWGWNIDRSWGHSFLRHGNAYQPLQAYNLASDGPAVSSWFFLDAQTEVVLRNYATDGANFVNSRGVARRPLVLQISLGTTYHFYHLSGTYFLAARTKEFETQKSIHYFGGLKADIKF